MSRFTWNQIIIASLYNLLKPIQKTIFKLVLSITGRKYVVHCSRRIGKTFVLCILSSITALSTPNAQVRYASVTQKSVRKMIKPIFKKIFSEFKIQYRPKWNSFEGAYIFSNGSMIHVAGVNNGHEDDLRGTDADLAIIDEAAFVDNLEYLTESVLMPQLINTGGRLIMASSSPLSPAHEFAEYIHQAKAGGYYSNFDIYQSGYSPEVIEEFIREAGGKESTACKREYFNELIVDEQYAIVSEMRNYDYTLHKDEENYKHYHKYNAMDLGVKNDLNVNLFAYYDFLRAKVCIESELSMTGPTMTTPKLHKEIAEIELDLWGLNEKGDPTEPYKRVADNNNPLLLLDLGAIHNMFFHSTSKDNLHAMVNEMRKWFQEGRIEIHESCVLLIESLKFGVWNEQRTEFGRSKTLGHFDAVAALMYLLRNIDQVTNPIPVKVGFDQVVDSHDDRAQQFKQLMGMRKS